ncbi:class I SAM-dependent methyltransferase [Patescibacteria group bacterium]|nr:class I SAM-dependent methyltransferase [Patescibacteria group bacterium]MBU1123412.1 class I SAM-dependent methyltransferase [Patescibacteria group bacterium]MBU1911381.1 class I SAM-dependent methyltransferase [Patescibacteria group bacterium]
MDYHFSTDWFTIYIPKWEEYLKDFKDKPNLNFLEVGSWEGRSTCWLLNNILTHTESIITCIDTFPDVYGEQLEKYGAFWGMRPPYPEVLSLEEKFDHNVNLTGSARKVRKLKGESQIILRGLEPASYDFIYIDGSHLAADVLSDIILCWPLLNIGGVMICDDYQLNMYRDPKNNPRSAIDSFLNAFEGSYQILNKDRQVIMKKTDERPFAVLADSAFGLSAAT